MEVLEPTVKIAISSLLGTMEVGEAKSLERHLTTIGAERCSKSNMGNRYHELYRDVVEEGNVAYPSREGTRET